MAKPVINIVTKPATIPTDKTVLNPLLQASHPNQILILGATGAIGQAFYQQMASQYPDSQITLFARNLTKLQKQVTEIKPIHANTLTFKIDLESTDSIDQACSNIPKGKSFDLIFIASGWLHDAQFSPEKTWKSLDSESLHKSYQINAVGPTLFLKTLFNTMNLKHPTVIGVLSARVGSISDNRMGGWHSYRASKAALNMLIKNMAIELQRKRCPVCIVGLQPGTTDSALSKPFQRHLSQDQLQSPAFTSQKLFKVMQTLTKAQSGTLLDFEGQTFEP